MEFTKVLEKIQKDIWIPHRAAEEYLSNRLTVIQKQEISYVDALKSIGSLKESLDNARHHPFVSPDVMKKSNTSFDALCNDLEKNRATHNKRIYEDEIKEAIASLFHERVGNPYDDEKLLKIISDGEIRYKQKIPPGYKDALKKSDNDSLSDKCRAFGDLIIWNQIIDKSKEVKKGVVLVIDDKKEDWWEIFSGKTIGPRPELVKEFTDLTNSSLYMYQADRFLELAQNHLGGKIDEGTMEEIRAVRKELNESNNIESKHRGNEFKNNLVNRLLSTHNETPEFTKNSIDILLHEKNDIALKIQELKKRQKNINQSRKILSAENESIKPDGLLAFSEQDKMRDELKKLFSIAAFIGNDIEKLEQRSLDIERELISLLL